MATYNSISKTRHKTLALGIIDTLNFTGDHGSVSISNRSSSNDLFVTTDGVDPAVNGDDSYIVLPGTIDTFGTTAVSGHTQVKVTAGIAAAYSVFV